MIKNKVVIQGYPGSYHDLACHAYFKSQENEIVCADSFSSLGNQLKSDSSINHGIMAIENSIAGTILQNYRILREQAFTVIGEVYLRIDHCLMCLPSQKIDDLSEIHSHPMAINQCRRFLNNYPQLKLIDSDDTALSAKLIQENRIQGIAAIASSRAAELYDLEIIAKGIEDNKQNYTRFFIIQKHSHQSTEGDKASIYLRVPHNKGSLLSVLQIISNHNINLSKLQSFPVLGRLTEYLFHLDLEFENLETYHSCKEKLAEVCIEFEELGIYNRANISAALRQEEINIML